LFSTKISKLLTGPVRHKSHIIHLQTVALSYDSTGKFIFVHTANHIIPTSTTFHLQRRLSLQFLVSYTEEAAVIWFKLFWHARWRQKLFSWRI